VFQADVNFKLCIIAFAIYIFGRYQEIIINCALVLRT